MAKKKKIVIVGAGHVGSHCARALANKAVCDEIVLVDKDTDKAMAQAMDVADALSFPPLNVTARDGELAECKDADIVVIAVGKAREKGKTRLDLAADSAITLHELAADLKQTGANGIIITITNPADIAANYLLNALDGDRFRIFGTGTLLDTARLIRVLSEQTGVARGSVSAFVLGEHGDSSVIPMSAIQIGGLAPTEFEGFDMEDALKRTRQIGMDIIEGKGSTEFGIGQSLAYLASAILGGEKLILPLSVRLEGEYGIEGINCGVPCLIGSNGIEKIIELPLTEEEKESLHNSAQVIRKYAELAYSAAPLK